MKIFYKNNNLEKILIGVCVAASAVVMASFVLLFGFDEPIVAKEILYLVQAVLLFVFITEKVIRFFNVESKSQFWRGNWYDAVLLLLLAALVLGSKKLFDIEDRFWFLHVAVGAYLVVQVVVKVCRTTVNMAATGNNPTKTLITSFIVLISCGAGTLMLPKATTGGISFVDALFTSTSATCVTGLIVKDTGSDFTLMGQTVILTLIQLGGLGIVVFGAILALLLGQALNVRESVVMQDLLSANTLGKIGHIIAFIFLGTVVVEGIGAVSMLGMWDSVPGRVGSIHEQWFYSIFHSVSAFCNAGFSLFSDSFISYQRSWGVFVVICPLIILGGFGFGVLYNIFNVLVDRFRIFCRRFFSKYNGKVVGVIPRRLSLQTKIVLSVSSILIISGTIFIMLLEHYAGNGSSKSGGVLGALFQSISSRTAGFNTVDISTLSDSSKMILILLMFVGGSPGSSAGGIKTVTLAVIVISTIAVLRKRSEVEIFKRSIRTVVIGRAITITLLFLLVLCTTVLALSITEHGNGFTMSDIIFESASALGTVGLSTGITGSLTTTGKVIIMLAMLIGRLGPLTLLASLTFNLKPAKYNYPEEAVIVG